MPQRVTVAVCIALVLMSSTARGSDLCVTASPLAKSVLSPCSGILVPPVQAQTALLCLASDLPLCRSARAADVERFGLQITALGDEKSILESRAFDLERLLEVASEPPPMTMWYEHPAFWASVGFVAGAALVFGVYELAARSIQ